MSFDELGNPGPNLKRAMTLAPQPHFSGIGTYGPIVTINGTVMKLGFRYSGPPSKILPMLRDLPEHDNREEVHVEIDTAKGRHVGRVFGLLKDKDGESIRLRGDNDANSFRLPTILAFRITKLVSIYATEASPQRNAPLRP